MGSLLSLGPAA